MRAATWPNGMPVRALDIVQIRGPRCGLVRAVMSGQVRLEAGDGWHAPEAIGIEDLSLLLTGVCFLRWS